MILPHSPGWLRARKRLAAIRPSCEAIPPCFVATLYVDRMAVRFEWDEGKDRANIVKHGVGFVIIREDRVIEGEERLHAIGYVDRVLLVVHTIREEGLSAIIRIISVRKATSAERKLYEESQ